MKASYSLNKLYDAHSIVIAVHTFSNTAISKFQSRRIIAYNGFHIFGEAAHRIGFIKTDANLRTCGSFKFAQYRLDNLPYLRDGPGRVKFVHWNTKTPEWH